MSHTFSKQQKLVAIKGNGCKLVAIDLSLNSCSTIVVVLTIDRWLGRGDYCHQILRLSRKQQKKWVSTHSW